MDLSSANIELIRKELNNPSFEVFTSKEWGSYNPGHRFLMRDFLQEHLAKKVDPAVLAKIDFSNSPIEIEKPFVSFSHTKRQGLIACSDFPLGADLEETRRVSEETALRVTSSPDELQEAPSSACLWTAKEATYKALWHYEQPSVISSLTIGGWQNIDSQYKTFSLLNPRNFKAPENGHGICLQLGELTYCFFCFCA